MASTSFFFSSRRRHTRSTRDWSSDVCSSDLHAAQYVALRALGEPDALPTGDLVLRRMAAPRHRMLSARELEERARDWRPWRGYAVMHLWRAAGSRGARIDNRRNQPARVRARA